MKKMLYSLAIASFTGLVLYALHGISTAINQNSTVQAAGATFALKGMVTKQDRRSVPWVNTPLAAVRVWIYDPGLVGFVRKYRIATSDSAGKIDFGSLPISTAVKIELPYPQPTCCSGIWDGLRWTAWIKIIPNTLGTGGSAPQYTCGLLSSPNGSNTDLLYNKRDCNNFILGLKPR
jgi:hypothetical protein